MQGISALLLDIDGTVLDTTEFIYQAAEHALAENGYPPVSRNRMSEAMGGAFEDFYRHILGMPELDPLRLEATHRVFQLERPYLSQTFPGTVETLEALKKRGYRLAAVTNRERLSVIPTLAVVGMENIFEKIVTASDVHELKPSPVPVLLALEQLQVTPLQAVMIGDSDFDVQSGKRAGVKTIRARYGFYFSEEETKADIEIHDIKELLDIFPGRTGV